MLPACGLDHVLRLGLGEAGETDRQTDTRPMHYAYCYRCGQHCDNCSQNFLLYLFCRFKCFYCVSSSCNITQPYPHLRGSVTLHVLYPHLISLATKTVPSDKIHSVDDECIRMVQ